MNLYESISNNINADRKKDILEDIIRYHKEYDIYKNEVSEMYIRIIGLCATMFNEEIDFNFLKYLYDHATWENIELKDMIKVYLTSKGIKDEVEDFEKLVDLTTEYIEKL